MLTDTPFPIHKSGDQISTPPTKGGMHGLVFKGCLDPIPNYICGQIHPRSSCGLNVLVMLLHIPTLSVGLRTPSWSVVLEALDREEGGRRDPAMLGADAFQPEEFYTEVIKQ